MKTKKRFISFIVGAIFAICICSFSPIMSMQAYATSLVYGDFNYVIEENDEITIIGYNGTGTSVDIPQTIDGKKVTQIGACAFEETDIVHVKLPDSITTIGYAAFSHCKKLETINFPDGLKVIGEYAFSTCHSLEAIELGNQVESIGYAAFQLCISLAEVTVPGTVKTINDHTFHGCYALEELIFEEGVTTIKETAALNLYSLKKISVPKSVTKIGEHALGYAYYHPDYTRINSTIYGYVGTAAETYATANGFDFVDLDKAVVTGVSLDCTSATLKLGEMLALTATITPDNVLNDNLIWSSDNENVAKVDKGMVTAIAEGTAKITVTTEDGNKTATCIVTVICDHKIEIRDKKDATETKDGYTGDEYCTICKKVIKKGSVIPKIQPSTPETPEAPETPVVKPAPKGENIVDPVTSVTYIVTKSDVKNGAVAFSKPKNKKIKSVTIPDTVTIDGVTYKVTSIQKNAFSGCTKLTKVTIGKNVTTIDDNAFYKCTKLSKITIPAKVSKIGKQAFYGCKKLKSITIKTKKLTSKKVGSKAFTGTPKNTKVTVPSKSLKSYKKFLYKKGLHIF